MKRLNSTYPDQTRNLNAHKAAIIAMCLWGARYAAQRGGCMDFWDTLNASEKRTCREIVARVNTAREETPEEAGE